MRIIISGAGGLRGLHLASKLDERGYLDSLYTTHFSQKYKKLSRFFINRHLNTQKISLDKINTNLKYVILNKIFTDIKLETRLGINRWFIISELIDKSVARKIGTGADILFAESNIALHTMRKVKKTGMICVLDRTNSHILYQKNMLEQEYDSLGIKFKFHTSEIIKKGLQEYEESDYIACLSSFVKKTFTENNVPENKLLLLPSGVDLNDFVQIDKEDNIFRIIYCGSACIKKGTHYLLRAFSELSLPNAELMLIGRIAPDIEPFLKKYEACCNVIGPVPHAYLYKYYSQGSVFILPSLEEGMAKVIMEAMSCGLPVIATENTGASDIVRHGLDGFIIPVRNIAEIKEKMLYMYENQSLCRDMGVCAKNRLKSGFTWNDYADRVVNAFNQILYV